MAREVITRFTSDVSGKEIGDSQTPVLIRISWPENASKGSVVLDAEESEVKDWLSKGRTEKPRGRAAAKK